jgi:hypothetical protein
MLADFAAFMDSVGSSTVTIDTALRWATMPTEVGHAYLAQRISAVRGFARYCTDATRRPRSRRLSYCDRAATARLRTSTQTRRSPR